MGWDIVNYRKLLEMARAELAQERARIALFADQYREWEADDDAGYDALIALCKHHALAATERNHDE